MCKKYIYYEKGEQAQITKRCILLKRLHSSVWLYAIILISYYLSL